MTDKFLKQVYGVSSQEETDRLYAKWAASYDAEVAENGYATPARCAAALWKARPDPRTAVLDYGCGTGLSGLALRQAGFEKIDGTDPSPEMLDGAREKEVYRNLTQLDLSAKEPVQKGRYSIIAAIGVIGVGAAPVSALDLLMRALPEGGVLGFSFNDHALADPAYEAAVSSWTESGRARLLTREYGPHLPKADLNSNVYVLEKT